MFQILFMKEPQRLEKKTDFHMKSKHRLPPTIYVHLKGNVLKKPTVSH